METITISDYKDLEQFKKNKQIVYEYARNDKPINLTNLSAPEYKYFAELYDLYNNLAHNVITKESAAESEKKLYNEYVNFMNSHTEYLSLCAVMQTNIQKASGLQSEVEKAKTIEKKLDAALRMCEAMTGETGFYSRNIRILTGGINDV